MRGQITHTLEVESDSRQILLDDHYIDGIRNSKPTILNEIYRLFYPKIQSLILRNSGTHDDAKDIFQDALVAIFHSVKNREFKLTSQFSTYLYSVCRNLWLKNLRRKDVVFTDIREADSTMASEEHENMILMHERYQLYKRKFNEIGEQCQKLLLRFMEGADMKTIADEFGFASVAYAKKRKFKCKEQLISKIEQDNAYKITLTRE